jgi:hypothetical protein
MFDETTLRSAAFVVTPPALQIFNQLAAIVSDSLSERHAGAGLAEMVEVRVRRANEMVEKNRILI